MPRVLAGKPPAQSVSVRDGLNISQQAAEIARILSRERGERVDIADVMGEAFEMYRVTFCANRDTSKMQLMLSICGDE